MGHFQGSGERAKFRHKFSVLTLASRTVSSKWTGKGRPGLSWLPATSGLCPSTDRWVPEAPRYPVPPPHAAPSALPCPSPTAFPHCDVSASPPRQCSPAPLCSGGFSRAPPSCRGLARPGPGQRRGPGRGQQRGQQALRMAPSARLLAASTGREPSAGTRDVIGCSGPFRNLPEKAANQEGASQVRFPSAERVLGRVLVWSPLRPWRRSLGGNPVLYALSS